MRFTQRYDREWVQPVRKDFVLKCCDCGGIHYVDFRIYRGKIQFRASRKRMHRKRKETER